MNHGDAVGIVLIEDDDGHATLVERNLRRAGVSNGFVRFSDGQEALDYFFGTPAPNTAALTAADPAARPRTELTNFVVLLDLKMPVLDGWEVLEWLRRIGSKAPVIVLSGAGDPASMPGVTAFVRKPLNLDELLPLVRSNAA